MVMVYIIHIYVNKFILFTNIYIITQINIVTVSARVA